MANKKTSPTTSSSKTHDHTSNGQHTHTSDHDHEHNHNHSHGDHDHHDHHHHDHHDHHHHDHNHSHNHNHGVQNTAVSDNTVLSLNLKWSEIAPAYQKELRKYAKKIKAPGFRHGHTPLKIAEERIGREYLVEEMLQHLLPKKVADLINESKKTTLAEPEVRPIDLTWGKDWELAIHIAEKPSIKLGSYQKIAKTAKKKAQEEFDNDAKKNSQDSLSQQESSKKPVEDASTQSKKQAEVVTQAQFEALIDAINPSIPELLVRQQTRTELERIGSTLKQIGLSVEDYIERRGITTTQLTQETAVTALRQLQLEFILQAIAEDQTISASDLEITERFESLLQQSNSSSKLPLDDQTKSYLKHSLVREKTVTFLRDL